MRLDRSRPRRDNNAADDLLIGYTCSLAISDIHVMHSHSDVVSFFSSHPASIASSFASTTEQMEKAGRGLAKSVHPFVVDVWKSFASHVLGPRSYLRIATPAVDIHLDTTASNAVLEELIWEIICSMQDNEGIAFGRRPNLALQLVEQAKAEVRRVDITAVDVADTGGQQLYIELRQEALCLGRVRQGASGDCLHTIFTARKPPELDFDRHPQLFGANAVGLCCLDVIFICVVVRAVDHDRVDGSPLVRKVEDSADVFVCGSMVDVNCDWNLGCMAGFYDELDKVDAKL